MKKILLYLVLAGAALALFNGCSTKKESLELEASAETAILTEAAETAITDTTAASTTKATTVTTTVSSEITAESLFMSRSAACIM